MRCLVVDEEITVSAVNLEKFCEDVFKKSLPDSEAEIIAKTLVDADLRGATSHGVQRVAGYLKRMEQGIIERSTKIEILNDALGTTLIDANNGWGQVAAVKAMELAVQKAEESGIAFVGVRNSNHFGTASFYTRLAAKKGYIGISMTNASPMMVPYGSKEPSLGANPISISIPAGPGENPIVLDMSSSNVARGKIMIAKINGESIPENWAVTKDGEKTTDPAEAWEGYVLPMGAKGSGLAIVIDILSGVLTGSLFGKSIPKQYEDPEPQRLGHFIGAINIANYAEPEVFYQNIKEKIQETTSSEPASGFDRVFMPGERGDLQKAYLEEQGIAIAVDTFNELKETGLKYGVEIEHYLS